MGTKNSKKMDQNSIIGSLFFCQRGKKSLGRSPLQELEVGPRSGPYFLVPLKNIKAKLSNGINLMVKNVTNFFFHLRPIRGKPPKIGGIVDGMGLCLKRQCHNVSIWNGQYLWVSVPVSLSVSVPGSVSTLKYQYLGELVPGSISTL